MNNPMQMLNEFMKFKNSFRGNPQQEVNNLMASGKMSQAQLNQLQMMARQMQAFAQSMGVKL